MKDNILSVNFETQTAPIVKEIRGENYIEYGTEDWRNLYPQFLIDLYYNSSTHAAIINATAEMISGDDLVIDDDGINLETYVDLKKFLRHANGKESLHQVIKKVAFDFKLQGAYAIHVIWNKDKTKISEVYHVPVERVRAGKPNALGQIDCYYISADWSNVRENKPYRIDAFNTKDRTAPSQLLYTGAYSPNMDVYHTPDYIAANNWALVDQKVAEFHLNNIENGFSGSYFISFANGIPTQEERFQIEQSLVDKFAGAKNSGKFILTFSDDKTRTPEITPISVSDADKQYLALQELLVQNILTGHRVTSPMLMGIKSDTGLGNNADELNSAANFYLNTVVKPFQLHILNTLQTIFSVNNMDLPVEFVQLKPITTRFTNQDLMAVMTQDEVREELGLPPLEENIEIKENLAKVGSMVTDGVELPLFETKEEAEAEAKRIGCSGSHEHKQDGKTYYMPCENHESIKSLDLSKKTELDLFLETMEDIPEDWELIEEEVVDGEHLDFDYEAELNNSVSEQIELTSTGRANPNARSKQDGLNKSKTAFYKVRYVYTNDNFLVNETDTTREFCSKMMSAKKIYRKEDILRMEKIPVNPGFGPYGADKYSIWLYKGGPQCQHFWLRQVYKAPKTDENYVYYPDKIQDDKNIGYTKAKSEGFTAKRNDKLVARPPKRMRNHGYIEER
ncbi:MAG: putative portal protein [Prokaryotic dsDNA virus sp.]|nr:MAG: putative portal protein [Prokaryotic dsDNA virus sp.]|tara:strand:- start:7111 stop:9147 length:2037 start_codon:yes stop_codon:yes gene_type:complete